MIKKEEYIKANLELETLIKIMDAGEDVDLEIVSVSDIIEEYENLNFPIGNFCFKNE